MVNVFKVEERRRSAYLKFYVEERHG